MTGRATSNRVLQAREVDPLLAPALLAVWMMPTVVLAVLGWTPVLAWYGSGVVLALLVMVFHHFAYEEVDDG